MQSLSLRPVALEHAQAYRVLLHLEDGLNARAIEAELKAADTRKQADGTHRTS